MACIHTNEAVKVLLKLYLNNENLPTESILNDSELKNVLPKLIENGYIILSKKSRNKTYYSLNYTENKVAYCLENIFETFLKNTSELLSLESLKNSTNGIL